MCPCGNQKAFEQCCGPYIAGEQDAPTAEALMRSRYVAFTKKNYDYIKDTHDAQTIQLFNQKANQEWAESVTFTGLTILAASESGNKGTVEFQAAFRNNKTGESAIHHEISKFRKQAGVWFYRDGREPKAVAPSTSDKR